MADDLNDREQNGFDESPRQAKGHIDDLLNQAEQALASINTVGHDEHPPGVTPFHWIDFAGAPTLTESTAGDQTGDAELDLTIELGRTHLVRTEALKLSKGAVVPLDNRADDPVDIYVNGGLIARGEVLILDDNFCVRVAELIASDGNEHGAA